MRTSLKMPLTALALAALWACVDSRGATGPRPPSFSRATGDGSPGALYVATNAATLEGWARIRDALASAISPEHLAFFNGLELSVTVGDYHFVHAGVRPGVPLAAQSERDLLWIRADFIGGTAALEKVVVHGHSPVETPVADGRRICVDTGAYATGVLTAVRLYGEERSFIQQTQR